MTTTQDRPTRESAPQLWWEAYNYGGKPHLQIIRLEPWMAEQLLGANPKNRHMNVDQRKALAGAITRGEWTLNNDAIVIGVDGYLDNGQHRCGAVIEAGRAIDVPVMFNAPVGAEEFMDQGAKRTFGNVLQMRGEPNANLVASVTASVYWWETDRIPVSQSRSGPRPTLPQLLDVLDRHPAIRDSIQRVGSSPVITRTMAATHHYVFSMVDSAGADEFMDLLRTGEGLSEGHPIYALRERLLRERMKATGNITIVAKSHFIHRAWHAWQAGATIHKMTFREGGWRATRFPIVEPQEEE
jgi:hypothetical protein